MSKIAILLMLCALITSRSFAGQAEVERFRREYPAAAEKLKAHFAQVRGACRLLMQRGGDSLRVDVDRATFAADHGFQKVTIERDRKLGAGRARAEVVYCVGPDTAFSLSRLPGAGTYSVQGIGSDWQDRSSYDTLFGRFLAAPYSVVGNPLTRIMAYDSFRLVSAEEVDVAGQRLVRVDYEVGGEGHADKAWLHLDPANTWAIRGGEVRFGRLPGGKLAFEVQYGDTAVDGLSFPRRVTFTDPSLLQSSCEFDSIAHGTTPASEFTMGFHGLPDLTRPHVEGGKGGMVVWLAGLAALGFAASLVLRRFATRHATGDR